MSEWRYTGLRWLLLASFVAAFIYMGNNYVHLRNVVIFIAILFGAICVLLLLFKFLPTRAGEKNGDETNDNSSD